MWQTPQKLKPGMTANVTATVPNRRTCWGRLPNAALDSVRKAPGDWLSRRSGTLYRVNGANLEPVKVRTGLTYGAFTQIVSGDNEGTAWRPPVSQCSSNGKRGRAEGNVFGNARGRPQGGSDEPVISLEKRHHKIYDSAAVRGASRSGVFSLRIAVEFVAVMGSIGPAISYH